MCILSVGLYALLKIVGYYDLSVLSMSVMGFQKSLDGGWVGGVSSIHFFLDFWRKKNNFAKPLTHIPNTESMSTSRGENYQKEGQCCRNK